MGRAIYLQFTEFTNFGLNMFSFTIDYRPAESQSLKAKNQRAIISVGAGRSQLSLIQAIKSADYTCIAFDRDANAPGRSLADVFFECSTHDADSAISHLSKIETTFNAMSE